MTPRYLLPNGRDNFPLPREHCIVEAYGKRWLVLHLVGVPSSEYFAAQDARTPLRVLAIAVEANVQLPCQTSCIEIEILPTDEV